MSTALQPAEHVPDTLCAAVAAGRLVLVFSQGASVADVITQASAVRLTPADLRLLAAAALDAAQRIETPSKDAHADPA